VAHRQQVLELLLALDLPLAQVAQLKALQLHLTQLHLPPAQLIKLEQQQVLQRVHLLLPLDLHLALPKGVVLQALPHLLLQLNHLRLALLHPVELLLKVLQEEVQFLLHPALIFKHNLHH
jgi:hypothetical protein